MNRCCRCHALGQPLEPTGERYYPWRMRCVDWFACDARHNAAIESILAFLRGDRAA